MNAWVTSSLHASTAPMGLFDTDISCCPTINIDLTSLKIALANI